MKVLLITISPMRGDISVGNTYENLFSGLKNCEFKSIYLRSGMPNNQFVSESFQIDEKMIIKKLLKKSKACGRIIRDSEDGSASILNEGQQKVFNKARLLRPTSGFILRDLIWKTNVWKTNELKNFVEEYKPDVIFTPFAYMEYLNDVIMYAKGLCDAKMICYAWDDNYAFKSKAFSPLTFLYYARRRKMMRNFMQHVDKMYVISSLMKEKYEKIFGKKCNLLFKGYKFEDKPVCKYVNNPIKMVFTGNIAVGRWKQLALIGNALQRINEDGTKIELDIYTASPINEKMKNALDIKGCINLKGSVPHSQVEEIQNAADVLVHCESDDKNEKKLVKLSFSTKLVDYFNQAKCVFAVGPKDVASMDYLIQNDAAIVATNEKEIEEKLKSLIENPDLVKEYADKAWECGRENHQIDKIQDMLYNDFKEVVEK